MNRAFSLVELSIVLVILGLLVGGVLMGRSLIHAAELRKHMRFHEEFTTAWSTFRDKYFYYPGDMPNASMFWGKYNAVCPAAAGVASATGTCDGNGDGRVHWGGNGEMQFVPQHLTLAGLGIFNNNPGSPSQYMTIANGLNQSDMYSFVGSSSAAYADLYGGAAPTAMSFSGNGLQTARLSPPSTPILGTLMPEDVWNIDTKMDDGKPQSGRFQAANSDRWGTPLPCLLLNGSSYEYNVSYTSGLACRYILKLP